MLWLFAQGRHWLAKFTLMRVSFALFGFIFEEIATVIARFVCCVTLNGDEDGG